MPALLDRKISWLDALLIEADHALKTVCKAHEPAVRPSPANTEAEHELSTSERQVSTGCIRVNHTGEICAQALYRGQALTAKQPQLRQHLLSAAREENDHLNWCQQRLDDLQTHTSYLNVFWYGASFKLGVLSGLPGDRWSLGFVIETENQVEAHLDHHLARISERDMKSRAILEQMKIDEAEHAMAAQSSGGQALPKWMRCLMKCQSKVMTSLAFYI